MTIGSLTQPNGESTVQATALGASVNLLVAGYFSGTVDFGSTQLVSAGASRDFCGCRPAAPGPGCSAAAAWPTMWSTAWL